ncbi:MAG: hypothetical protein ACI84R_004109 [Candidatus Azotimanducaceae bacterium]|jgi:hypothetical protein
MRHCRLFGLPHQETRLELTYQNTNPRILLSILWVFIILNFFARDIHELGRPGMLEQMMSGTIDGVVVTEMLMLIGGIMVEIPILMTVLALLLSHGINRWANIGVGLLTMVMIVAMNLKPDLDNVFFMGIQLIALIAIVGIAWQWRASQGIDTIPS